MVREPEGAQPGNPALNLENRIKKKAEALKLTEGGLKRGEEHKPQP